MIYKYKYKYEYKYKYRYTYIYIYIQRLFCFDASLPGTDYAKCPERNRGFAALVVMVLMVCCTFCV